MFDYLQQFNSLPKDLKNKVSSPQAMATLTEIENRYQVDLAMIVMKVMIKSLAIKDLPALFIGEFSLSASQAEALAKELKEKIFSVVADYVGLNSEKKELDLNRDINLLITEAGLTIPSEFLIERLKKIVATYLKGVRSRIDTRESLAKDIASGGLGLSAEETDRILKVCDSQKFKDNNNLKTFSVATPPGSRLDKIITANDKGGYKPLAEYDFKKALAAGEVKRLASPDKNNISEALKESKEILVTSPKLSEETKNIETIKQAPVSASSLEKKEESVSTKEAVNLNSPGIVRKPESTSLLKKIFNEEQKKTDPGSVKFATQATIKDASAMAGAAKIGGASTDATARDFQRREIGNQGKTGQVTTGEIAGINRSGAIMTGAGMVNKSVAAARMSANNSANTDILRNQREALTRQNTVAMNRQRVQDVRVVPKVMGPLEELQFLDLTNFRRLGKTPEEITMKIFNKIKLLEKDGYDKMIAGIIAWKKSPVSLLYLKMVQEAIASGKTLKESVALRQDKGHDILTMSEIEAIMKFNSKLVF